MPTMSQQSPPEEDPESQAPQFCFDNIVRERIDVSQLANPFKSSDNPQRNLAQNFDDIAQEESQQPSQQQEDSQETQEGPLTQEQAPKKKR